MIEHHHTISSIGIILRLFVIKSYGSSEIIHCFLVVSNCHESSTSVSMILCMSGTFITWGCWLQTGNCLGKCLNCKLCILFILFLIVLLKKLFGLSVFLNCLLLLSHLLLHLQRFALFSLRFCDFWWFHKFTLKKNKFYLLEN